MLLLFFFFLLVQGLNFCVISLYCVLFILKDAEKQVKEIRQYQEEFLLQFQYFKQLEGKYK